MVEYDEAIRFVLWFLLLVLGLIVVHVVVRGVLCALDWWDRTFDRYVP